MRSVLVWFARRDLKGGYFERTSWNKQNHSHSLWRESRGCKASHAYAVARDAMKRNVSQALAGS